LKYVQQRRKKTTINLAATGTVKSMMGTIATTNAVLTAPIMGRITITPASTIKAVKVLDTTGSFESMMGSIAGPGSLVGSKMVWGSQSIGSLGKVPTVPKKLQSSSMSPVLQVRLSANIKPVKPVIPDYSPIRMSATEMINTGKTITKNKISSIGRIGVISI
jgi:hypothetical protein